MKNKITIWNTWSIARKVAFWILTSLIYSVAWAVAIVIVYTKVYKGYNNILGIATLLIVIVGMGIWLRIITKPRIKKRVLIPAVVAVGIVSLCSYTVVSYYIKSSPPKIFFDSRRFVLLILISFSKGQPSHCVLSSRYISQHFLPIVSISK